VQEALQRSAKQEDYLGTPNTVQIRQKKLQLKPMWAEKAKGMKFTPSHSPFFQSLLIFSKARVHLFLDNTSFNLQNKARP
jgi:hypothetical protein